MKKRVITIILLVVISTSLTANPSWNPWIKTWTFTLENEESFTLRFKGDSWAYDLETGDKYGYVWGYDMILKIYQYPLHGEAQTLKIQVEEFTDYGRWAKEECSLVI